MKSSSDNIAYFARDHAQWNALVGNADQWTHAHPFIWPKSHILLLMVLSNQCTEQGRSQGDARGR